MERYIFIREFKVEQEFRPTAIILKGSFLHIDEKEWQLFDSQGNDVSDCVEVSLVDLFDEMRIYLLALDADIFTVAYNSLPYRSWLNEKASEIDEQGLKTYEDGLNRSPETLIMYLMEVGVTSDTLARLIFGAGSNYSDFIRSIQ